MQIRKVIQGMEANIYCREAVAGMRNNSKDAKQGRELIARMQEQGCELIARMQEQGCEM